MEIKTLSSMNLSIFYMDLANQKTILLSYSFLCSSKQDLLDLMPSQYIYISGE